MGNSTTRARRSKMRGTKKRTMRSKHMKKHIKVRKGKTKRRSVHRKKQNKRTRRRKQRGGGVGYGFTGKGNEGFGGSYGAVETFSTCS